MNEVDHKNDDHNTNNKMKADGNNNSKDDDDNMRKDDDEYFRTRYDMNYNPIITIPNSVDDNNNNTTTIRLPILKHGYRIVPLSWDECYDIIVIQKYIPKLSRSVQQQTDYEIYRYNMLKEWKSVIDQILCTKFNTIFEKRYDKTINKYYSYPLLSDFKKSNSKNNFNTIAITLNEFPYNMENNIEHYIVWKLGNENITEDDISNAKEEISLNNQNYYHIDFIHWTNPPHLKSIPDIDHIHILCRKNKQQIKK